MNAIVKRLITRILLGGLASAKHIARAENRNESTPQRRRWSKPITQQEISTTSAAETVARQCCRNIPLNAAPIQGAPNYRNKRTNWTWAQNVEGATLRRITDFLRQFGELQTGTIRANRSPQAPLSQRKATSRFRHDAINHYDENDKLSR